MSGKTDLTARKMYDEAMEVPYDSHPPIPLSKDKSSVDIIVRQDIYQLLPELSASFDLLTFVTAVN